MGQFLNCWWRCIKNEYDDNVKREIITRSEEEVEAKLMKFFQAEIRDEEEQNKRAIAVAATTVVDEFCERGGEGEKRVHMKKMRVYLGV